MMPYNRVQLQGAGGAQDVFNVCRTTSVSSSKRQARMPSASAAGSLRVI